MATRIDDEVSKRLLSESPRIQLSVITPTYNEAENIARLIAQVDWSLDRIPHEIIVADGDSPDLTWLRAQEIAKSNSRVRVLRRTRDRGLAPAVVEAFGEARGEFVACIDADLQHDPSILPTMLERLENGHDLVIGSRYCKGSGVSN